MVALALKHHNGYRRQEVLSNMNVVLPSRTLPLHASRSHPFGIINTGRKIEHFELEMAPKAESFSKFSFVEGKTDNKRTEQPRKLNHCKCNAPAYLVHKHLSRCNI